MAEQKNTYRVELSKGNQRDTAYIEDASQQAAEASGDSGIAEEIGRSLREVIETGEETEKRISSPSGDHFRLEIRKTPAGGHEIITRRRTPEYDTQDMLAKELREAQMQAFLGSQIAKFAHEVRNDDSVVLGRCDLLKSCSDYPSIKGNLDAIRDAGRRIEERCNLYMRLHKEQKEEFGLMFVHESLDRIVRLLDPIYRIDGVEIETQYDEGLPQVYACDDMLHSLWLNLLKNAFESIKLLEREGKITVKTGLYQGAASNFEVQVSIEDTGCGMNEETVRAWKKQDQAHFTTKQGGQGIGRYVIYDIIRKHRMGFSVESELGKGTSFSVYFPKKI